MKTVFVDLDGVLANIHKEIGFNTPKDVTPEQICEKGFFLGLEVMPAAIKSIETLLSINEVDLWIATKIPKCNIFAASEKLEWVAKHFPALKDRVIIIPDKTLLIGDFLIDDDCRWEGFSGKFLEFNSRNPNYCWGKLLEQIKDGLDNNLRVEVRINWDLGEVVVQNNSTVEITELRHSGYLMQTSYDGDLMHASYSDNVIRNLRPGESTALKQINIPEKGEVFILENIKFSDGQIIERLEFRPF